MTSVHSIYQCILLLEGMSSFAFFTKYVAHLQTQVESERYSNHQMFCLTFTIFQLKFCSKL